MQAKYGTTALPANGADITTQLSVTETTEGGAPLRYMVAANITLFLLGTGQADLTTQENAFRAALLKPEQDFILYTDAGQPSSINIVSKATATGTRVINIGAPNSGAGEFATKRTIAFVLTAEYHVKDTERAVVMWRESISITGNGGPRRSWRFPVNPGMKGVRQQISAASLVRAVQQGEAVGYRMQPTKPAPIFPGYVVNETPTQVFSTPKNLGQSYVDYGIQWSYTFERGDGPLVGLPSLPPGVL